MATDELVARAVDGARLAVSVHGEGRPLLMIPGLGATRAIYDPLVPALARRLRVIVHDPRGVGDSEVGTLPVTMAQLAADAVAVLDAVGVDEAAVFGASMGGMVAQHLTLDHPQRVSALVLAATTCGGSMGVAAPREATNALLGRGAHNPEEAYRMACTVMYAPDFRRRHGDFIEEQIRLRASRPVDPRVFRAQWEAVRRHDTCARLGEISVPTLVLHGSDDLVVPVGNGMVLAATIPGARLQIFEGGGHLFFHEAPRRTAEVILAFLDEIAAVRGAA